MTENFAALAGTRQRPYVPLGCYLAAAYVVIAVYVVALASGWQGAAYWAAPLSALVPVAGAAVTRELRLRRDQWLTPGNIALGMWLVDLVLIPVLLIVHAPCLGPLRVLPADGQINTAMLLQALAFVAFGAFFRSRPGLVKNNEVARLHPVPLFVMVGMMAIGALGMVLMFRTPAEAWAYYAGNGRLVEHGSRTSLGQGVSALMRPFLGLAGVALVQRELARTPGRLPSSRVFAAAALVFVSYSSYQYNRQTVVVALLSLIAALSLKARRVGLPILTVIAIVGAVSAISFGTYRLMYIGTRAGEFSTWQVGLQNYRPDPLEQLETYIGAPQFVALSIQGTKNGVALAGPGPVLASVFSPVPVIGKSFRNDSTTAMYNTRIYGSSRVQDQHPPFVAELFWTLGIFGVIGGFAMLGWATAFVDRRFARAGDVLDGYIHIFSGISLAFFMSFGIVVLAQTSIYFLLPAYLLRGVLRKGPVRTFEKRARACV